MPGYKGHLAGGCVVYGLLISLLYTQCASTAAPGRWLLCVLAGALFPDIDVKSRGQNYFYWLVLCMALICIARQQFYSLAWLSLISIAPMLVRHRGIFHRWWFIVAVACSVWMVILYYAPAYGRQLGYDTFFFIMGAFSHLWLDVGFRRMFRW